MKTALIIALAIAAALLVAMVIYDAGANVSYPRITVSPQYEPDPADWSAYEATEDTIHIIQREEVADG